MEEVIFKAELRNVIGKQVKAMRRAGKLPAVLYGKGVEPTPIVLDLHEAKLLLSHLVASSLVTVELEGEKHKALVREKQRDFIRGTYKHIDFQAVSMIEKLRVSVGFSFVGEAPAIKEYNGVLVTGIDDVEIECLPGDLTERIVVDISNLKEIGDAVYVRDLVVSDKIEILAAAEELVIVVTSQAAEEIILAPGETIEPEVIEKGKKEEEL